MGNVAEFDLLRAQVSVSNQVPVVLAQVNARDVAYLRLKQLLNVPYEQRLALTTSVEDSTAAPPGVDLAKAASPDTATDHRASVREAGETVASQKGLLKVAHAERIPTLAVSSAYSRVAYPSSGLPTGADFRPNWTVTLGTSFPIFAGGRIRGDEMVAQANLRDARSRLQQARELASLDARVALSTLDQAQATLAASSGTAAQAQRAFDIATVRFREGISTQLELNDIRNQLAQALVNRAQAARNLQVARVRLALHRRSARADSERRSDESVAATAAATADAAAVVTAIGAAGRRAGSGNTSSGRRERTAREQSIDASFIYVCRRAALLAASLSGCGKKSAQAADSTASQLTVGTENIVIARQGSVTNGPAVSGSLDAIARRHRACAGLGLGHFDAARRSGRACRRASCSRR